MKYRKLPGRIHQWHNHPSCPELPAENFIEHEATPPETTICPVCMTLAKINDEIARRELNKYKTI